LVCMGLAANTFTADDGSSRAQAEVHADVRDDLVRDDVRQACDTLSRTVVRWYCELNHAPRPAGWPRVELPLPPDELDVAAIVSAAKAGLKVPAAWMRGRLGIPDPQEGEEVLSGMPVGDSGGTGGGDGDDEPSSEMNAAGPSLNAALDAVVDAADWGEIAQDLVGPLRQGLAGANTAEGFAATAAEIGAPEALAADLARQAFPARVDGEVG
ncbi:MAG: DUF935 family protein, partial [Acidobacteriota bacterium]|nr:DUF935 family protein [Acidobacteriota bacterium]